jgi:hypothetical protein
LAFLIANDAPPNSQKNLKAILEMKTKKGFGARSLVRNISEVKGV